MTRDFASFYREITGKELPAVWQQARIHRTEVHTGNKAWFIYVGINDTLNAEIVRQTAKELHECITYLDYLEIIPLPTEPAHKINEIIAGRKGELSSSFFDQESIAEGIEWMIKDDRLDLIAEDEATFNYLIEHEVCNHLADWFWEQYSLRVLVRALATGHKEQLPVEPTISGTKAEVLEIRDYTPRPSRKRERRHIDLDQQKVIPLSEVQEGLKNLVVEGEVWNKEISSIRGDRYVVTYYLTDYTDTLLLKTFLDNLEDDRINVGDAIRVGGSL